MGYGGNLIWTAVFKSLNEAEGKPVRVAYKPGLSDLLRGRLYNGATDLAEDAIFRGNPRLEFTAAQPKGLIARTLDFGFAAAISPRPIKQMYEHAIFALSERLSRNRPHHLVHVDMVIHSYAERQLRDRFIWKTGGHAIATILRRFSASPAVLDCELYFEPGEETAPERLLAAIGEPVGFLVVEPHTNREWFGDLRSWPLERWQALVTRLGEKYPDRVILQIGLDDAPLLDGVIDLRGRTTFREAALLISQAALFIGTESGLMHAANAVGARAVIIWGGVTLPEFAGYPDRHRVLCSYVDCAPCGQFGWCDNDHVCMRSISVDSVFDAVIETIPPAND